VSRSAGPRFAHALVVGGTGMLAEATRFVRAHSDRMTLMARTSRGAELSPDRLCLVDWGDEAAVAEALGPSIAAMPPDLALLWIHDGGRRALLWLLRRLAPGPGLVVHVLGSSAGDPRGRDEEVEAIVAAAPRLRYVTVVLGSRALPDGRRRWLTHPEISGGAIEAIERRHDVVVGAIVPSG